MRRSDVFLLCLGAGFAAVATLLLPGTGVPLDAPARTAAHHLAITDPCLFTEARYTRHLALADAHAPFQEHPLSLEHFPSGSLARPPLALRASGDGPASAKQGEGP